MLSKWSAWSPRKASVTRALSVRTAFWPILVVVAVIPVFDIGNLVLRNTAIAHGYAWTLIVAHLAMATSVILCGVWLIPKYLGVGLALSLLAGYASLLFVQYCFYRGRS
jgi:hypothetical protein